MNREGSGDKKVDQLDLNKTYTNPVEAKQSIEESGIDMLAVLYGTVYGVYTQKPHLSSSRLKEILDLVDSPLVVYGALGLTDEEYRKSVENGIAKMYYYLEMVYRVLLGV